MERSYELDSESAQPVIMLLLMLHACTRNELVMRTGGSAIRIALTIVHKFPSAGRSRSYISTSLA